MIRVKRFVAPRLNESTLRIDIFRRRRPYITYVLLALNVAVFAFEWSYGRAAELWVMTRLAQEKVAVWEGEYWRLLTTTFVHAGSVHLGINMFMLVYLGRIVEPILGWRRFAVLYLAAGLTGSLLFQAASRSLLGVGASGAVYGVFGSLLLLVKGRQPGGRIRPGWRFFLWAALVLLLDQLFAWMVESGNQVGICTSAHAGGFLAGIAVTYFYYLGRAGVAGAWWKRGLVAATILLSMGGLFVYGCLYTVHDAGWMALREARAFRHALENKEFERAVERWRAGAAKDERGNRLLGYELLDHLMASNRKDLARTVLERLIESGEAELRSSSEKEPDLYNEVAWHCGLLGSNLPDAMRYAEEAVRLVRERKPTGILGWLFETPELRDEEGRYINTRGWIKFLLGEEGEALRDLKEATVLSPLGANFLYLAIAEEKLGYLKEARDAALEAERAGKLSLYEMKLLEDLKAALGHS